MPNPYKVFPKKFNEVNIGDWVFLILLFSIVGTVYLAMNGTKAGTIYAVLISLSFVVLLLLTLLKKDEDKLTDVILIPFSKKFSLSVFFYALGSLIPFILQFILYFSIGFSLVGFSVPLFTGDIVDAGQSFSVVELESQTSTKIFNIMYVAGSDETVIYNWMAMIFGAIAGTIIIRMFSEERNFMKNKKKYRWLILFIAYAFSIFVFVLSHKLNNTYISVGKFIIAGIFLLISNLSMFQLGLPISFWIGYHQSNNLIYLVTLLGLVTVLQGFLSLFGVIFVLLWVMIGYYIIKNWDVISRDLKIWWNNGKGWKNR